MWRRHRLVRSGCRVSVAEPPWSSKFPRPSEPIRQRLGRHPARHALRPRRGHGAEAPHHGRRRRRPRTGRRAHVHDRGRDVEASSGPCSRPMSSRVAEAQPRRPARAHATARIAPSGRKTASASCSRASPVTPRRCPHARNAQPGELEHDHRSRRILRECLIDPDPGLLSRSQLAGDEVGCDQLRRGVDVGSSRRNLPLSDQAPAESPACR